MIKRDRYLNKLIKKKDNGMIKIITGIRRCGKSVLLFDIYYEYLLSVGVKADNIIKIQLDKGSDYKFRNPVFLCDYIKKLTDNAVNERFYVFIDEIQFVENVRFEGINSYFGLYEVLNELNDRKELDVYVTGSNSRMLSKDIATEFRGRGDPIRVYPLSFKEFYDAKGGDKREALEKYMLYGGMPKTLSFDSHEEKREYLEDLFTNVYIKDVLERNKISNDKHVLDELLKIISSSIGSLTNPTKLSNTFATNEKINISHVTLDKYVDYFCDAFLIEKAVRFDIKGKKYINSPLKYYFCDVGLRNAVINFRQVEPTHIMENIIYNELLVRGFSVDVGAIEYNLKDEHGKSKKTQLEIDFICTKGGVRYYIQSAYAISDEEKKRQETRGFSLINDSFKRVVVIKEALLPWRDENGILYIGLEQFLLNENSLDL